MVKSLFALACVSAVAIAAPAYATVIDFNSAPDGQTTLVLSGVTFTAGGGAISTTSFGNSPNGTRGIVSSSGGNFNPFRADIAGGTNSVSVDIGDFNGDADDIFLRAFDASDMLIGSDTFSLPSSFIGMQTLSVSVANIAYVTFGGVGVGGSSVYGDNFTFAGAGGVPEPAAWAMMIAGFGLVGGMSRRRARARVAYA